MPYYEVANCSLHIRDSPHLPPGLPRDEPSLDRACPPFDVPPLMNQIENTARPTGRLKKSTFYDSNALIGYSFMRFRGDNAIGGSLSGQFAPTLQTQARLASAALHLRLLLHTLRDEWLVICAPDAAI